MKKLLFIVICLFALSASALMSADTKTKESAEDAKRVKKAKELLSKAIENVGGLNKINEVKTMYIEGVRDVVDPSRGIKEPFKLWWIAPDKFYAEFAYYKPVSGGYDGVDAWAINPYMSGSTAAAKLTFKDLTYYPEIMQILMPEIIRYEENKMTLRYEDDHELKDGKDYSKIRVTNADNSQEDYYFNPTTKFLYKRQRDDFNYMNKRIDLEIFYKEWQLVNGVQIPKYAERFEDGVQITNYYINKVEINIPIDIKKFAMPKDTTTKKPAPAGKIK
ncbi:MAG: hypothetical protein WCR42_07205 [bacterium]